MTFWVAYYGVLGVGLTWWAAARARRWWRGAAAALAQHGQSLERSHVALLEVAKRLAGDVHAWAVEDLKARRPAQPGLHLERPAVERVRFFSVGRGSRMIGYFDIPAPKAFVLREVWVETLDLDPAVAGGPRPMYLKIEDRATNRIVISGRATDGTWDFSRCEWALSSCGGGLRIAIDSDDCCPVIAEVTVCLRGYWAREEF